MPRNIEERLNEIAQRATDWLGKFGVSGEIELVKGRKCEKKWFWGWGAWENPDFTFVYKNIEIGVFVQKYRAIRTSIGLGSFVEAKAFGKIIYLTHDRIVLPFSIDLALTFYPFFVTFLGHNLVSSYYTHLNFEKRPPSLIIDTRAKGEGIFHFRMEIESADKASLWVNDNPVLQGNIVEVLRTYNRLIALSNL
jgi:hypothetical protein